MRKTKQQFIPDMRSAIISSVCTVWNEETLFPSPRFSQRREKEIPNWRRLRVHRANFRVSDARCAANISPSSLSCYYPYPPSPRKKIQALAYRFPGEAPGLCIMRICARVRRDPTRNIRPASGARDTHLHMHKYNAEFEDPSIFRVTKSNAFASIPIRMLRRLSLITYSASLAFLVERSSEMRTDVR
jgi:hypothetical protein